MTSEYVTDTTYVRHFDPDLAPARSRLIAALNGFAPPPRDDFDYCELGCAHGDTLVALAAANPRARFVGIDLNPAHIESATALAKEGGVSNVRFLVGDFNTLTPEELGTFHYVAAHGVLSWVGPETRAALLKLASAILAPGGLLHASYNAMPGWGAIEPLRQLLLSPMGGLAEGTSVDVGASPRHPEQIPRLGGPSLDRARRGLAFARALEAAGAEYFVQNPSARAMLGTMEKAGLAYVVHEYLHANWAPMYFAQVAWEMSARDLHFVGVLPAHLNFRDMAVPASMQKTFEGVTDRMAFESLRDFATNEFFRRDLYVKGKPARSAAVTQTYFDETPFGLVASAPPASREHALPHRTLKLEGPIYDALFVALASGAKTVLDLAQADGLAAAGADKIRSSLIRLLLVDLAQPMSRVTRAPDRDAVQASSALRIPSLYNRTMLARLTSERPTVMAVEAAGTGRSLTVLEALALRALTEAHGKEQAWTRALFESGKLKLRVGHAAPGTADEQARMVAGAIIDLRENKLQKLVELGVVEVG